MRNNLYEKVLKKKIYENIFFFFKIPLFSLLLKWLLEYCRDQIQQVLVNEKARLILMKEEEVVFLNKQFK